MAEHLGDLVLDPSHPVRSETPAQTAPLGRSKELLILRHAKSSWSQQDLNDFDRPLNERGQQAAPLMGRLIASLSDQPLDCVLVSAAVRTRQTWELLGLEAALSRPPMFLDSLYLAEPVAIAKTLRDYVWPKARRVLVIGHNPGLQAFCMAAVEAWPGGRESEASQRMAHKFPTAALARFSLNGAWQSLGPKSTSADSAASEQASPNRADLNLADLRLTGFATPRTLHQAA